MRDIHALDWLRELLLDMDDIGRPIIGIHDWDDAVCTEFKGKLLISSDGPYEKRLVMKSALIHAATDILAKGGRPLFALDNLGGRESDITEMATSLRKQAEFMKIPILGGNTKYWDREPSASITVVGELLLEEPIRDSTAKSGDVIALFGKRLWGEQKERLEVARAMFSAWYDVLNEINTTRLCIDACKDVTKGGIKATVEEIAEKSGLTYNIDCDDEHLTRNLDNLLIAVDENRLDIIRKIAEKHNCPVKTIGLFE